jgi:hypothetical protein
LPMDVLGDDLLGPHVEIVLRGLHSLPKSVVVLQRPVISRLCVTERLKLGHL